MSLFHKNILAGASGAAGGASGPLYVDDVFSTFLYTGTGASHTIANGIDLSGEGGLVWMKSRTNTDWHYIIDTERGGSKIVFTNSNVGEVTYTNAITSFNSNGFTLGNQTNINNSSHDYASYTFRKAPKFFDVVTYSGTSSSRTVSHNLGSVPGCIIIKSTSASGDWYVYHRDLGTTQYYELNNFNGPQSHSAAWGGTAPTATEFSLGFFSNNVSGRQYVAYLFAHDESDFGANEDESIVYCGSFSSAGGETQREVNIGWEPQFLLRLPDSSGNGNTIHNAMSGFGSDDFSQYGDISKGYQFTTSNSGAESNNGRIALTATGFKIVDSVACKFIAIRRPHKPPSAATEVFATDTQNSGPYNAAPYYRSGFVVDAQLLLYETGTSSAFPWISARLTANKNLVTAITSAEDSNSTINKWDFMNGFSGGEIFSDDSKHVSHMFRRAPGFFDVVTYIGNSTAGRTVTHNLGVTPELMLVKRRSSSGAWEGYVSALGETKTLRLNSDGEALTVTGFWNDTAPTSSVFTVGTGTNTNGSGETLIAYLFASLAGISKVGSYTGTGSNIGVDCGFTAGARLVIIKRTDSTGDWYVFDSHRGIVSGNDPYLLLNEYDAEVTNTDYIDPLNSGFTVTSSAPAALNASGGTYIFLAIA